MVRYVKLYKTKQKISSNILLTYESKGQESGTTCEILKFYQKEKTNIKQKHPKTDWKFTDL